MTKTTTTRDARVRDAKRVRMLYTIETRYDILKKGSILEVVRPLRVRLDVKKKWSGWAVIGDSGKESILTEDEAEIVD